MSFSHRLIHQGRLVIISVSARGPCAGRISSSGTGPLRAPAAPAATAFMVRRCVASWLLKASDVMTSHDTVRRADRARQSSPALPAGTGAVTQVARPRLGPLHEGRVLLGRVRGYFMRCGGSCSTHSPWPVHPRPRAVRRPEEGSGQGQVEPAPPGPLEAPPKRVPQRP
ncbi:hypothetical protein HMPREF1129_1201 [Actinomyces naeslundii str. Howell 279]|uniref:Uncharacterized protein n=1 Tax=Actinomyces naeslundii (strain ATCC 12104 / DSM 43013 / CCUG 2238 / JCM 8349 / NCTC 10301 / Howell 279) TaxID=1115803 RepID=J3ABE3_ACTNH|nr:hypothetical protein HMPREF1129_1201 [Actinomyces naeslundii str. Howell 279]